MIREQSIGEMISNLQSIISNWSETPALDAQVLLADIVGRNRAWLLAHPEATLTAQQHLALENGLARLKIGEPLPYILGHWEFFGMDFTITADTLIPRPETELLVEQALKWLWAHPGKRHAADVGTGSGCIAVSLAAQIADLHVTASDISPTALAIAKVNTEKHHVADRVDCVQEDLLSFAASRSPLDIICANLPYIPTETLTQLDVLGREPTLALDGGPDGLSLLRRLLPQATRTLAPESLLLLEIETTLGNAALTLASEYFPEAQINLFPDLAGHDRLIRIETFAD